MGRMFAKSATKLTGKSMSKSLFDNPPKPRAKPRVMMHVIDAGDGMAQFGCRKCGHETDWESVESVTVAKRGIPCPKCNEVKP